MVALGDSITRGRGGAPALGVHPQSWALWLAEALEMPYTNLAVDGARAADLVRDQAPRLRGPYDLATLHVGANDTRAADFDADAFARDVAAVLQTLARQADRLLVLTLPLDLGRPRAGEDVETANAILRRLAAEHDAAVCSLEDFGGARVVRPAAVHPTSAGMVEIACRAAATLRDAGLPARCEPAELAEERTDVPARARYAAWYGRQLLRDRRRRVAERWRYRG